MLAVRSCEQTSSETTSSDGDVAPQLQEGVAGENFPFHRFKNSTTEISEINIFTVANFIRDLEY